MTAIIRGYCTTSILVCLSLLIAACVSNQANQNLGPMTIAPIVVPAKDVPEELEPYRQHFDDIITSKGLWLKDSSDQYALHLQFEYVPTKHRVGVYLLQGDRIVVSSSTEPGMFFHKDSETDEIGALVNRTAVEFDDQLTQFLSHVTYEGARPAAPQPAAASPRAPSPAQQNQQSGSIVFGTAFATNSATTYVTARHVVDGATRIRLYCGPDRIADAEILMVDTNNDLAVLKSKMGAPAFLELAPNDSAGPGDHVFTIGFPTPDLLGVAPKYTDGAISSLSGVSDTPSLMQITVPIQPGNSGGPLADSQGRVVGMIDSTAAVATFYHATGAMPQNVNFAVSSYYLYPLVKSIPRGSIAKFAKFTPVKRVTASLCMVVVNQQN